MESLKALIERAEEIEPVQRELVELAACATPEVLAEALTLAMQERTVDGATNLALALLSLGVTAPADVVERLYPDVVDERAGNVLLATHEDRAVIFEALFTSRRPDRYQLAMAAALFTHLGLETTPALLELLRRLARNRLDWVGAYWAHEAVIRIADPQLSGMYPPDSKETPDPKLFEELGDEPSFASLRTERSKVLASGFTARRAQPKVGRNEPCPCGSGKKYKKCCAKKQDARSSLSPIRGITMREYRRRLHEFLDADALIAQHPADLAELPFDELTLEQLNSVLEVFVECERMELAENILTRLCAHPEVPQDEQDNVRAYVVGFAHDWGHEALVARQVPLFSNADKVPPYLQLGHAIRNPDEKILDLIEASCRAYVVDSERPPYDVAYELLATHPALGVLLTRGSLDVEHAVDGWRLLDEIEWARDKLGAPPNDPFWDVWQSMLGEQRLARTGEAEQVALREELARARLDAEEARAKAHVLARDLGKYEGELADLEARAADAEALAEERLSKVDLEKQTRQTAAARELRRKIRELEGHIREGQHERADLRQRAREADQGSHEVAAQSAKEPEPEEEEAGTAVSAHGLRVPVWTDKATSSLEKMPRNIAGAALAIAGALGAGRPEAWRHAKRLEGMHGLCSARLGIHHRLLFWLEEDGVLEVDEVVTREGLDRALAARR